MEGKPMKRKPLSIIAGLAVVGASAAGGAAFTASNTIPNTVMGYGTSNITGATATSLTYTRTADGTASRNTMAAGSSERMLHD